MASLLFFLILQRSRKRPSEEIRGKVARQRGTREQVGCRKRENERPVLYIMHD